jgi:class 3 adenylate cyclase
MTETRKLVAIPAADVVGFSRLAGADEDRAIKTCNRASTPRRR